MADLVQRSKKNGVPVRLLNADEVKEMEPNISPKIKAALYAPTAGIIDPFCAVVNTIENAVDNGVELLLNNIVLSIKKENDYFIKSFIPFIISSSTSLSNFFKNPCEEKANSIYVTSLGCFS